jgi:hypothetical protein
MSANLVGWVFQKLEDKTCIYRLQLSASNRRLVNKLTKQIGGKLVGEGHTAGSKETVLIFEKKFKDKKEWVKFAKELEINVREYNDRTGKYREISKRKRGRPRKSS